MVNLQSLFYFSSLNLFASDVGTRPTLFLVVSVLLLVKTSSCIFTSTTLANFLPCLNVTASSRQVHHHLASDAAAMWHKFLKIGVPSIPPGALASFTALPQRRSLRIPRARALPRTPPAFLHTNLPLGFFTLAAVPRLFLSKICTISTRCHCT